MKISTIGIHTNFLRQTVTLLLIVQSVFAAQAQKFAITKLEVTGGKVIINYDLVDTIKARAYEISVHSSMDNFRAPLQKIEGDAGIGVTPGRNKKITWSFREEFGLYSKGDVELEVRGKPYVPLVKEARGKPQVPPIEFDEFQEDRVIRRGKPTTVTWTGGMPQNILNFSLYNRHDQYVAVIPNVANSGRVELTVPTTAKPGKGYYFMVSNNENKDQVTRTPAFEVRRKVPLLVKAVPVLVVGGLVAVLAKPSSASENLAGPPATPTDH